MAEKLPSLVIVGRPNVGKSTLFNRLTGTRRAIVTDEPGITRDRMYGKTEWNGRVLEVVDTGGIVPDDKALIPTEIFRQARVAFENAALLVLVVDSQAGLTPLDQELARLLRATGKPFVVAVNKIDSAMQEANAAAFYSLGVPVFPIAAEHGTGVDDLLDEALKQALGHAVEDQPAEKKEVEIAIIGRPNVGKSTLLNRLAGEERSIVSPIPGTTMDNVDTDVVRDGRVYRFVDTAGIRRKGKTHLMAEKLSVVMARKHLEAADIALMVIDATEGVSALDAAIAGYAHDSGRSVIIVVNKWDLVTSGQKRAGRETKASRMQESKRPADREAYEERLRDALKFLSYAPVLFVSAATGTGTEKIFSTLKEVAAERRKRITTGEMNRFIKHVDFERASVPMRARVKIYYLTQASTSPPTFVLFTDRPIKLHFSYQRFLENQIRKAFGFVGTPIWIKTRARD